jgi:aminoglycoside phosphotransferase family enzyme/predicted kinase
VSIPLEQQEVARFLRSLSGGEPKETHISAVFIGKDTVWKLKKAVRLPFLDFTSVGARRHFLQRELTLNQPAAPEIYRDVAAVMRRSDGSLDLSADAQGTRPLDWVLRMAPVPEQDFLDVMAGRGELTPAIQDALGDCVARYHAGLRPVPAWDGLGVLLRTAEGNARSAIVAGLAPDAVLDWLRQIREALQLRAAWLAERVVAGFVRRCHGDLHLGNLCLWQGTPVPFDALEFDEELATIDVGYDLAFLLMDLDRRVDRTAANRVMNRVIARTGDAGLSRGLPPFLSMRAMVRAHVRATAGQAEEARTYLAAAQAYLAQSPAFVLAIGGLQGTGKSTLARILAPEFGAAPGAVVLRSDEIRKRLHSVAPEDRLPESAYSDQANAAVNDVLVEQARSVAAGGHTVIVDATFLDPGLRSRLAAGVQTALIRFLGIWLHAPLPVLEARINARHADASDATVAILRRAAARDPGALDWLAVDASDCSVALATIRRAIATITDRPG